MNMKAVYVAVTAFVLLFGLALGEIKKVLQSGDRNVGRTRNENRR